MIRLRQWKGIARIFSTREKTFDSPFIACLIASLITDSILYAFLYEGLLVNSLVSLTGIALFVAIISIAYIPALTFLLRSLKRDSEKLRDADHSIDIIYRIAMIVQYFIAGFLALITLQLFLESKYSVALLLAVLFLSFSTATVSMALMSYRLFSWYRRNRNLMILLYGLITAIGGVGTATIVGVNTVKIGLEGPAEVGVAGGSFMQVGPSSGQLMLLQITYMPFRITFVLIWIATALLLNKYSKKLGKNKYWSLMSLPLILFGIGSILAAQQSSSNSVVTPLLVVLSLLTGATLFGAVFWTVARSISQVEGRNAMVANYLRLSGIGAVLLIISVISPVIYAPYPPFGIIAWSFVGLGSFMFSVGIYSSAISVSQDAKLRQSIRKFAVSQSRLLHSIGTAQMEQELQKRVLTIAKSTSETMSEETGVQISLTEDDMRQYLDEIIQEIKNKS